MNNQTIRFNNGNGATLNVLARNGKTGVSIFLSSRQPGQRAVVGMRSVFLPKNEKEAQERFDALVADVTAKGWTRKTSGGGATTSMFNEIPAPDAPPAGPALKAKTAPAVKPVAVKPTAKAK